MAKKRIVYPRSLKDIPLWRRHEIARDILWFGKYPPTERLAHIDREWEDIQDFIRRYGRREHGAEKREKKEISLLELIAEFNRAGIRYLVIGRRAMVLHGAPVLTGDHDLRIHTADGKKALGLLAENLGFEHSHPPDTKRPSVMGLSGMKKYDLFFHRSTRNMGNELVGFDECYRNSVLIEDPSEGISFRVPCIDDLIRLKKIRKANVKDEQDIEYLLKAKQLKGKS
jgi:hypothetical protein